MIGELFCFILGFLKLLMTISDKKTPFLSVLKAVALHCLHQGRKTHGLLSKLPCPMSVEVMHSTDKFKMVSVLIFSKFYDLVFDSTTFVISDN